MRRLCYGKYFTQVFAFRSGGAEIITKTASTTSVENQPDVFLLNLSNLSKLSKLLNNLTNKFLLKKLAFTFFLHSLRFT